MHQGRSAANGCQVTTGRCLNISRPTHTGQQCRMRRRRPAGQPAWGRMSQIMKRFNNHEDLSHQVIVLLGQLERLPHAHDLVNLGFARADPCPEITRFQHAVLSIDPSWVLVSPSVGDWEIRRSMFSARSVSPGLKLAILSDSDDWRRCDRWLRLGCNVYLDVRSSADRIVAAIRIAEQHQFNVIDRSFHLQLQARRTGMIPDLTRRESEVLGLLAGGLRNKEIALRLSLSENTIEYHVRRLLSKLGVNSRLAAVERATALGLV